MIPPWILKDNLFRNVKMIYVLIELDNNNGEQDFGFKNVRENYILIITEFLSMRHPNTYIIFPCKCNSYEKTR